MQDQYVGKPGVYVVDQETGTRVPQEEWEAKQAARAEKEPAAAEKAAAPVKPAKG